jgi:hypothetical protein
VSRPTPDPLPRSWLPEPEAPAQPGGEALWEARLRRLTAAAQPALARLRARPVPVPWWSALAAWWRPLVASAALAAAAAGLVLGVQPVARPAPGASVGIATLSALAGNGDPAALWAGLGAHVDPALALLASNGGRP